MTTEPATGNAEAGTEPQPQSLATGQVPEAKPDTAAAAPTSDAAAAAGAEGDKATAEGSEPKPGAPEKYEDFTVPEGFVLDEAAMAEFLPMAKGLNLSQEQAQQLVDLQTKLVGQAQKQADAAWDETLDGWKQQVVADKDIGGQNLPGTIAACGKAIDAFGSPTLRQTLEATGVGNHPDIVRFFAAVGKAMSEDRLHVGNAQESGGPVPLEKRLFPNMN